MILSRKGIMEAHEKGDIIITPWDDNKLGTNSYDLHLADKLLVYKDNVLDFAKNNPTKELIIPEEGLILEPGELYLGTTKEYTETLKYVPMLEGRSSVGRLGMFIHVTAGFGDLGFRGHWTLEIAVLKKLKIYRNMRAGQIYYHTTDNTEYLYNGKYNGQVDPKASESYRDMKEVKGPLIKKI